MLRYLSCFTTLLALTITLAAAEKNTLTKEEKKEGFVLLFDGKSLDGWKLNEDQKAFVESARAFAEAWSREGKALFVYQPLPGGKV